MNTLRHRGESELEQQSIDNDNDEKRTFMSASRRLWLIVATLIATVAVVALVVFAWRARRSNDEFATLKAMARLGHALDAEHNESRFDCDAIEALKIDNVTLIRDELFEIVVARIVAAKVLDDDEQFAFKRELKMQPTAVAAAARGRGGSVAASASSKRSRKAVSGNVASLF